MEEMQFSNKKGTVTLGDYIIILGISVRKQLGYFVHVIGTLDPGNITFHSTSLKRNFK
jgi:hypothetical protein